MKYFRSFVLGPLLALTSCLGWAAANTADRPNFLFIISDDQAPDMVGALGNPEIKTPHLDRLVARGTAFTHCFNQGSWSGAVCVASRTMLITGQTVYRAPQNLTYIDSWGHAKDELAVTQETAVKLWPEVFRDAGYDTFLTGKWHNSDAAILQGFSSATAIAEGFYDTYELKEQDRHPKINPGYFRPAPGRDEWTPWDPKYHGFWTPDVKNIVSEGVMGEKYILEQHTSEVFADAAVSYLENVGAAEDPFFMFVAFNAPHDPRQAPKEFVEQYPVDEVALPANYLPEHPFDNGALTIRDELLAPLPRTEEVVRVHRAEYFAIITHMDQQIGRILDALEESGEADNTYVIFTSDHGLSVGSHGLLGKQSPYDHSIRMPFLITGPGIPEGRRVDNMIYMQSVYPMTCELAGLAVPATVEFPSITALATGESSDGGEQTIFGTYLTSQRMVRTNTHKLIYYPEIDRHQLFDLTADPDEITDLVSDPAYAGVKQDLVESLQHHRLQLGDGLLQ